MLTESRTTGAHVFAPVFSILDEYLTQIKKNPIKFDGFDDFNKVLKRLSYDFQEWTNMQINNSQYAYSIYSKACQVVILKFLIVNTNLYEKFIHLEEYEKVLQLYNRKQYNSKLLQGILIEFVKFYHYFRQDLSKYFKNTFTISFSEELECQAMEEVNRQFAPLKKVIEKIASGVVAQCYFQAQNNVYLYNTTLSKELNEYIKEKYNYDYNACFSRNNGSRSYLITSDNQVFLTNDLLQLALLSDTIFWESNKYFDITKFLNNIFQYNSLKHAQKAIDYIYTNLLMIPNCKLMIEKGFALCYADREQVIQAFNKRTRIMFSILLQKEEDIALLAQEDFCYPLAQSSDIEKKLKQGKLVWQQFIQTYLYPHDYEKFMLILQQELDSVNDTENWTVDNIHSGFLIDKNLGWIGYGDRFIFKAYCPDAFTTENILNRVYLKAYAAKKCIKDENKTYQFLHKIYLDCIEHFAKNYGIFTAQQLDNSKRENCYKELKKILKKFDIQPQEKNKEYYITALLDRDIAMLKEVENFAMLEQLGDAIYNFVVAELLFYNPNINTYSKSFGSKYDLYIQAQAQVQISKKYKFDTAYFALEWIEQTAQEEKYLADSLEMIIGAVCLDLGVEVAIQFVQRMLQESFSDDFKEPLYFSKCIEQQDLQKEYEEYIDYLDIITPKSFMHALSFNDILNHYTKICEVVQKVLLAIVIGTDTKEKRNILTYCNYGDLKLFNIKESVHENWLLYHYLKDGLLPTVDRYKDTVLANFKKQEGKV